MNDSKKDNVFLACLVAVSFGMTALSLLLPHRHWYAPWRSEHTQQKHPSAPIPLKAQRNDNTSLNVPPTGSGFL
jgi:hypothetical protein